MKKLKFCLLLLIVGICCCGCNGNTTRDIRHAGFTMGGTFTCSNFFPKDKEDVDFEKIRYMTDSRIINTEGKIYELSLSQKYANGENCKEADTQIRVKAIYDNSIIKGTDNKYYYLLEQNSVASYTEVPTSDNSYSMYDLLLKEEDVVKVMTADSSSGIYYVLKIDGNVYSYEVTKADYQAQPVITTVSTVYDKLTYGSNIVDFNYAGQSLNTFVKTEDKVYRMRITNSEECGKYADISCQFSMQEDPIFVDKKDSIISYNGSTLITDYKQVFTVAS